MLGSIRRKFFGRVFGWCSWRPRGNSLEATIHRNTFARCSSRVQVAVTENPSSEKEVAPYISGLSIALVVGVERVLRASWRRLRMSPTFPQRPREVSCHHADGIEGFCSTRPTESLSNHLPRSRGALWQSHTHCGCDKCLIGRLHSFLGSPCRDNICVVMSHPW